ncbi:hypothetical protein C8R43DRAFT_1147374 [Mycena crocata]|nr:hypothetical protein C8R43DRAFT_1147374 [Mycena crocata]
MIKTCITLVLVLQLTVFSIASPIALPAESRRDSWLFLDYPPEGNGLHEAPISPRGNSGGDNTFVMFGYYAPDAEDVDEELIDAHEALVSSRDDDNTFVAFGHYDPDAEDIAEEDLAAPDTFVENE